MTRPGGEQLSGRIDIDGSSTVGALTDAIAEEYAQAQQGVIVNVSRRPASRSRRPLRPSSPCSGRSC